MNKWNTAELIAADKEYLWHPFTPMHVLGKALSGGCLPLVITLAAEVFFWTSVIFEARKQLFFMVPSYTGNALACAAAKAMEAIRLAIVEERGER